MTLREMRERAGYTQVRLAELSGLEQSHISQLELGKVRSPQYDTLEALAAALETTPHVIVCAIRATTRRAA